MKRLILATALAAGIFGVILAQPKKETKSNVPKEDIKVNKKFDERGNLIQYDSTYTFNWSGDTTMANQMSPEDFQKFFGKNFGFFNDSTIMGNSFFDDFNQMFSDHLGMMSDSVFTKNFGSRQFHSFSFGNDSTEKGFPDFNSFFRFAFPDRKSNPSDKSNKVPGSMDDMMQLMQQQMKQMEEMQRKLFERYQGQSNQQNQKEF